MSNVHGLYSNQPDSDSDEDDSNNRFVGGISDRGGGSGLAVQPNPGDERPNPEAIFGRATEAGEDDREQVRRTITMYRDGFVVDDGPYRRLDDPSNADFLRSLAMGRTPRELSDDSGTVVVGLVDKREEDYVEEFRSFSGAGTSLGSTQQSSDGLFDPSTFAAAPVVDPSAPTTSIAVRLPNGRRQVIRLNLTSTVGDLAAAVAGDAHGAFRLVAGFPPTPLTDAAATVQAAGLEGAQVSMQKSGV